MSGEVIHSIDDLAARAGSEDELTAQCPEGTLRIVLRQDDIELWRAHLNSHPGPWNLLLACESDSAPLPQSRLTWVVGAAIRVAQARGRQDALQLLGQLSVAPGLLGLVADHCPGLGESAVWAFHLERHAWLTATPVQGQT